MTPKEKAKELVNKFYSQTDDENIIFCINWSSAKKAASIAVDEILYEFDHLAWDNDTYGTSKMKYWQQVKQEIEKL